MTHNDQPDNHVAKRVLARITDEHLVPRPRWEFLFKNYFFWTLGVLAVLIGALAFSAALFEIENAGWRLSVATHPNFFAFFLAVAPFLWVFVLALFVFIGYVNIRRTRHGYRYPLMVIALGAVLTSITLGSALYAAGFGGEIEEAIGSHPPFYRPILVEERSWWLAPEKGLLGGRVVSVAPGTAFFMLRDFSGHVWEIDGSDLGNLDLAVVAHGGIVRIVGAPTTATSSIFHACFVFPWETYGIFRDKPPTPPLATLASTSERRMKTRRSELCRGLRPYQQLRSLDEAGL